MDGDISAALSVALRFGEKRAATLAQRPERLLARNGLDDFVVIPGVTRLLWLLYLDQIHVVHHPSVNTKFAVAPGSVKTTSF